MQISFISGSNKACGFNNKLQPWEKKICSPVNCPNLNFCQIAAIYEFDFLHLLGTFHLFPLGTKHLTTVVNTVGGQISNMAS